jgi:hypothetical protein
MSSMKYIVRRRDCLTKPFHVRTATKPKMQGYREKIMIYLCVMLNVSSLVPFEVG